MKCFPIYKILNVPYWTFITNKEGELVKNASFFSICSDRRFSLFGHNSTGVILFD